MIMTHPPAWIEAARLLGSACDHIVAAQQEESDARDASARRRAEIQAEHPWFGVGLVDLLGCFCAQGADEQR